MRCISPEHASQRAETETERESLPVIINPPDHEPRINKAGASTHTRIGYEMTMTYEQYLDEIATLIHEKYDVSEADAIKFVVRAQAGEFFSLHDETPSMRTQEQAELDAKTVYEQRNKSNPKVFRK